MSKRRVASYCTTFLKPEMRHIYRQVSGLQTFSTFVITKERKNAELYPFEDVEELPSNKSNFLRRFWLKYICREAPMIYRGEYRHLDHILKKRAPDLLHIYFGHTGVHLLPFLEKYKTPSVVSFHGMDVQPREHDPSYRGKLEALLQRVSLALVRSDSLRQRLLDLGCPAEKIRLNRTGIPLEQFSFCQREEPQKGKNGAWHFVQACRLIPKKGLRVTLEAFSKARENFPNIHLTIAGEGPMLEEIQALAAQLKIQKSVTFAGFLSTEDLLELYHQAHIFIHPSQLTEDQNQEGVPNSMLEAMATGLPVIATHHGGIPEAVENDKTGYLANEGDVEKITDFIQKMMTSPEKWRAMSKQAAKEIKENFDRSLQIAKLEAIYSEAIEAIEGTPKQ